MLTRFVLLRPCREATVGKLQVALGDVVQLFDDGDSVVESADDDVTLGLVQAMWQSSSGVRRELLCCLPATAGLPPSHADERCDSNVQRAREPHAACCA